MRFGSALAQDLRYAIRLLRTNPGFAAVAVLSLALGIGANTAIFQLLDAVRMRMLPVKDPQELAFVRIDMHHWSSGSFTGYYSWLTNPEWEQIRARQQAFSSAAVFGSENMNLARGGEARNALALWVSGEFFNTLGVPALLGRVFSATDDQRGCGDPGVVISYSFWQREYGGAAATVGKMLSLEGHELPIVGVTPANFYGVEVGRVFDVAVPICVEPIINGESTWLNRPDTWWLGMVGRLKPGWTLAQANAQLQAISPGVFEATIPTNYKPDSVKHYLSFVLQAIPAANGTSQLRQRYENPLWMLLGIAGLVLLIACANLANLMLARASARQRELAVRLALGASRGRLIRQLLAESLLLGVLGAAFGTLLAAGLGRFMVAFISTPGSQVFMDLGLDWRVLGFTAMLATLTCLLFGLIPALKATRMAPAAAMNTGGRMTAAREGFGLRRALVVTQVALSLVLVAGALLFVRSLTNLLNVDAGYSQDGLLVMYVDFTKLDLPKAQRNLYKQQMAERVAALPGVEGAAVVNVVPISGNGWGEEVVQNGQSKGGTSLNRTSPGYFRTMGTPLLAGRDFGEQDTPTSPHVAIVNQAFAKKYFGGNPVGKTFHLSVGANQPDPEYEIVGLVKDSKYYTMREDVEPEVFVPGLQDARPDESTGMMIRSQLPLEALTGELRGSFEQLNPAIAIFFQSFKTQVRDSLLRERLMATLSGFFGLLAGVLAAVGLYGVIAYMVARRTNEIGVRMALGATPGRVLRMVLGEALALLGVGVAAGAVLTLGAGRATASFLYGLKAYDPKTMLLAVAALSVIALGAGYVPARRAAKLEPMRALREE